MSKVIQSRRGDLAVLHEAGAISKVTTREFSAASIERLHEALNHSQRSLYICTPRLRLRASVSKAIPIPRGLRLSCSTSSPTKACRPSSDCLLRGETDIGDAN